MPLSNDEARKLLQDLIVREDRNAAWIAVRIDRSYQWVHRRLRGTTRMFLDDFVLIMSAFERDEQ